jgi:hypothetical protein
MFAFLRILFPSLYLLCLHWGSRAATANPSGIITLFEISCICACLLLALATGLVWAPFVGEKLAQPVTDMLTGGAGQEYETVVLRWARWAGLGGRPRLCLWLCHLEGLDHPTWPAAFVLGLNHAAAGTWHEGYFARRVYEFENVHNCARAHAILERRGEPPPPHPHPEIRLRLERFHALPPADRAPLLLTPAELPPALQRNPRIQLFEGVDLLAGAPVVPAPRSGPPAAVVAGVPAPALPAPRSHP